MASNSDTTVFSFMRERAARRRTRLQLQLHFHLARFTVPDPAHTRTREASSRGTHSVPPGLGRTLSAHCKDIKAVVDSSNPAAWLNFLLSALFHLHGASHGFGPGDSSVNFRHQSITDCSAAPCLLSAGHCSNRDRDTPFDRPILFNTQTRVVKPVRS
ncbi:uncharacterized [Tachysurus ichikawai]